MKSIQKPKFLQWAEKKRPWLESLGDIGIFFIFFQVNLVEVLAFSFASFFPVYSFTDLVNGGLFQLLPNENKLLIKSVLKTWRKTCQVLTKTWLLTCQDLNLHLRRAKSKKWHDQSSDTVPIQEVHFHWISTYSELTFSLWTQKRMNFCRKFNYKFFELCLFDLPAAGKIWNRQFSV